MNEVVEGIAPVRLSSFDTVVAADSDLIPILRPSGPGFVNLLTTRLSIRTDPITDASTLGGYPPSLVAAPDTIPVYYVSSKIVGSITGDAASVGGFVANATATANQLLSLNGSGQFPASVIPDLSGTYQPLNSDLTAIAALSTTGIARRTGSHVWTLGTTVTIAEGGTGQVTALAGFNALSPMTTLGDLLVGGASGSATRLGN